MSLPGIMWLTPGAGTVAATCQFNASATSGTVSPQTYTNFNIGPAATGRLVVVCIATPNTVDPSAVTVGGISATKVVGISNIGGTNASIWQVVINTGSTATIVVTGSNNGSGIATYSLYNLTSTTAFATSAGQGGSAGTTLSTTNNTPANGFDIMTMAFSGGSAISCSNMTINVSNTAVFICSCATSVFQTCGFAPTVAASPTTYVLTSPSNINIQADVHVSWR